jgi:hypothetical protein
MHRPQSSSHALAHWLLSVSQPTRVAMYRASASCSHSHAQTVRLSLQPSAAPDGLLRCGSQMLVTMRATAQPSRTALLCGRSIRLHVHH